MFPCYYVRIALRTSSEPHLAVSEPDLASFPPLCKWLLFRRCFFFPCIQLPVTNSESHQLRISPTPNLTNSESHQLRISPPITTNSICTSQSDFALRYLLQSPIFFLISWDRTRRFPPPHTARLSGSWSCGCPYFHLAAPPGARILPVSIPGYPRSSKSFQNIWQIQCSWCGFFD
ncbi:hypothetical protein K438DRAFT_1812199 [Mycena galopus ATCC 62051]|nr:hypothetical protein K438DRAFT_1812199 [Mycena galopus ATCC 62051]